MMPNCLWLEYLYVWPVASHSLAFITSYFCPEGTLLNSAEMLVENKNISYFPTRAYFY